MRATVMFNGSLYPGEVIRETPARLLVRFTTGSGQEREGWFSKTTKPAGILVSRRHPMMGTDGYATLNPNAAFKEE